MLVEVSMYPVDKGVSLSDYVAPAIDIIDKSGLDYRLGPMGTTLEGDWDEVFGVLKRCLERMGQDSSRITFVIKGDYRKGQSQGLDHKVGVIEEKLKRKLKT